MDVQAYLDRIGYAGVPRVDLQTLTDLHRLHLQAIPYESLDVMLGVRPSIDPAAAYEKIVRRRRGGWCYEMNGLLGAMLREIGFEVTEMAGAVLRADRGPITHGNHLLLRVDLDRPYIADMGFGDGMIEPAPLAPGAFQRRGFNFRIEELHEDGWIRFHNHAFGGAAYFDFQNQPADRAQLSTTSDWLSSSPDSVFTQTALAFRHGDGVVTGLLGRTLNRIRPDGRTTHLIASEAELVEVLAREFGLDLPEAARLWPAICAKHDELFAAPATS
ncbi:arylamine N-acetyltransferase [Phenylobacterium sp.]|uniref:arylamine N-acetyltransferase family protein n=1 Tax=Phenylobacterium sp. TaxID=1871053 RepID=UPI0035B4DC18